jgi:hypothetical protein
VTRYDLSFRLERRMTFSAERTATGTLVPAAARAAAIIIIRTLP